MVFESVDAYVAAQTPVARRMLATLRNIVATAVPDAEETIAYNMPTYRRNGKRFIHFAAWPNHFALYAMNEAVRSHFASELEHLSVEGSTIRFSYGEPLPEALIARLVRFRAGIASRD
jgi:uncharacterized protein YdhG (YjbR/CyaY superfamily)